MKKTTLKSVFLTGLLILVPLVITLWVLCFIIGIMDQTLSLLLPKSWQPDRLFGFHLSGAGAALTFAISCIIGLATQNFVGQKFFSWWNSIVCHIPIVGSIYMSIKQVSDTLLSSDNTFCEAVLVEYPRCGSYTIAFLIGVPSKNITNHLNGEHVSVYIPTTPNPISGFFLMIPKNEVIKLSISVDDALKYIVSMGVVLPTEVRVDDGDNL
ncbi:MAG: DUF502 domain-containing protein [Burkholderia sp.]|nr:DUF502 domain-containing protein [Burkholderia sp.]